MPRGFSGIRQAAAKIEARRNQGGFGPQALYFSIAPGESAEVRFLEQDEDTAWCYVHEIPQEGRQWGRDVPCLDQEDEDEPCPGCEREMPKKFKGFINLIWFDAPVYKKDKDGKPAKDSVGDKVVIGNQDQVAVWTSGPRLFEDLDEVNDTYKGLKTRRFIVKRKGSGFDTKYVVKPQDADSGKQPMDGDEKELAETKYDLNEFMKIPTYEDFMKVIDGGVGNFSKSTSGGDSPSSEAKKKNPFMRSRS